MHLVVRYAQSAPGSCSTHLLLALPRLFAQAIEDGAIANLVLVVTLLVIWCREPLGDLTLGTKDGYLLAGEVHPIIGDDSVREAKVTHNILP